MPGMSRRWTFAVRFTRSVSGVRILYIQPLSLGDQMPSKDLDLLLLWEVVNVEGAWIWKIRTKDGAAKARRGVTRGIGDGWGPCAGDGSRRAPQRDVGHDRWSADVLSAQSSKIRSGA
jgi:hypothetical protein